MDNGVTGNNGMECWISRKILNPIYRTNTAGRVTQVADGAHNLKYVYDASGNRISETVYNADDSVASAKRA